MAWLPASGLVCGLACAPACGLIWANVGATAAPAIRTEARPVIISICRTANSFRLSLFDLIDNPALSPH
jgi:hypothetical protein